MPAGTRDIGFRRHPVGSALARHVEYAWSGSWSGEHDAVAHVPPDGRVELICSAQGVVVGGHVTWPVVVEFGRIRDVCGMQLHLGRAAGLLGVEAASLVERPVLLADMWGAAAEPVDEAVRSASTHAAKVAALAAALEARAAEFEPDALVEDAARRLAAPGARVEAVGRELGVSERRLRRRFEAAVGFAPKMLQRIERFQRFMALAGHEELAAAAVGAGYVDQAHLTRESRALAGVTPGALLREWRRTPRPAADFYKTSTAA